MYRKTIKTIFFLGGFLCLNALDMAAQRRVEGYVRDSAGQALEFANVLIRSASDKRTLTFGHTDERGFFALLVHPDSTNLVLRATLLGYGPAEIPISLQENMPQEIILTAGSMALKEVVVRNRALPMRQRSDTTEWRVASFADSTETSVEDLLRKLPGVEVTEQGVIKIHGKPIEKILIEGDDLFGRDYSLASRNIRANQLETVQAIDRYQDNPVLSGVKSSDAVVLNFRLREEVRRVLSATYSIGGGWGEAYKYYLSGNLFSFTKRGKTFLTGNANNTGFDAMADTEFFMSGGGLESAAEYRPPELPNESILSLPSAKETGLPRMLTRPDRINVAALNHLATPGPAWKIKIQGIAALNSLQQSYFNSDHFRLPDKRVFEVREDRKFSKKNLPLSAHTEIEYMPKHLNTRLKLVSQYRAAHNSYETTLIRSQSGETTQIPQELNERPVSWLNLIEYTQKTSENTVFQVEAQYLQLERPQETDIRWGAFSQIFAIDSSLNILTQSVDSRRRLAKIALRRITAGKWGQWSTEAGFAWQEQTLNTQLTLSDAPNNRLVTPSGYADNLVFRRPSIFLNGKWQRNFGPLLTTLSADLRRTTVRKIPREVSDSSQFMLFSPHLKLMYLLNRWSKLNFLYTYTPFMPNSEWLYSSLLWTDYHSAQHGVNDHSPIRRQFIRMNYTYNNTEKLCSISTALTASKDQNSFGKALIIDSLFGFTTGFRPVSGSHYSANLRADQFISALSSRLTLTLNYNGIKQNNRLNSPVLRNNFFQTHSIRLGYGSAFDGWVNVFVHGTLARHSAKVRSYSGFRLNSTAQSIYSAWRTVIRPAKNWRFQIVLHHVDNYIGNTRSSRIFVWDSALQVFSKKNTRRSIEVYINNILNKKSFEQVGVTDFLESRNGLLLVPCFLLLKYNSGI
jgi:hypothetical protein